jgi:hypothetical protein
MLGIIAKPQFHTRRVFLPAHANVRCGCQTGIHRSTSDSKIVSLKINKHRFNTAEPPRKIARASGTTRKCSWTALIEQYVECSVSSKPPISPVDGESLVSNMPITRPQSLDILTSGLSANRTLLSRTRTRHRSDRTATAAPHAFGVDDRFS